MSREIVFRGKRIDGEGWVYGSFIRWFDGTTSIEPGEYEEPMYAVHPDTVGQWTGLTDKNGKKIFEGDIVVWTSKVMRLIGNYTYRFDGYHEGKWFATKLVLFWLVWMILFPMFQMGAVRLTTMRSGFFTDCLKSSEISTTTQNG